MALGPESVPKSPPTGYIPLRIASPEIQDMAKEVLSSNPPLGAIFNFEINKNRYIARVEPHPPSPSRGLNDWHKGVTVYIADPKRNPKIIETIKEPKLLGTAGGATAGFFVGGPIGSIVGAAVGYVGSLIYKDIKK